MIAVVFGKWLIELPGHLPFSHDASAQIVNVGQPFAVIFSGIPLPAWLREPEKVVESVRRGHGVLVPIQ